MTASLPIKNLTGKEAVDERNGYAEKRMESET